MSRSAVQLRNPGIPQLSNTAPAPVSSACWAIHARAAATSSTPGAASTTPPAGVTDDFGEAVAPGPEGFGADVAATVSEQVERDQETLSVVGSRRCEVDPAVAHGDQLAVDDGASRQLLDNGLGDVGELVSEAALLAGLQLHPGPVERDDPPSIELGRV